MYKKKEERSRSKEIPIANPITKFRDLNSIIAELGSILNELKEKYGLSLNDIKELVEKEKKEKAIPVEIFNKRLSVLESVVKYLRENLNLRFNETTKQLNRNYQGVRTTYINSKKKFSGKFPIPIRSKLLVPIPIFKKNKLSALEALVKFLKEIRGLRFSEIAELLKRDQRTIWTVYQRAKKKVGEVNEGRK